MQGDVRVNLGANEVRKLLFIRQACAGWHFALCAPLLPQWAMPRRAKPGATTPRRAKPGAMTPGEKIRLSAPEVALWPVIYSDGTVMMW